MRIVWIVAIAVLGAATGYLFTRFERTPPAVETAPGPLYVGVEHRSEVRFGDDGTGIEQLRIWIQSGETEREVLKQSYPGNLFTGAEQKGERSAELLLRPQELALADGPAVLHVEARDFAWSANVTHLEIPLEIDSKPPRISALTGLTYVRRGGVELAVYRVGEATQRDGVRVGETFFPGFPFPGDASRRVALYAYPWDAPAELQPQVVAVDRAGNEAVVTLVVRLIEQSFPRDEIALTTPFMQNKVAEIGGHANGNLLESYLKINGDVRRQNDARIREICQSSRPEPLWTGAFVQLPNSHVGARFAEARTYTFEGREVDHQTHLGFDLASLAASPVPAANAGVVAFAGTLGIYGQTVILDHGLGLFSLYGHLSDIGVDVGKTVAKGESLGHTGQTGLAGGDHLHYAILVSGTFVDPIEWFDPRWIREHLEPKLAPSTPTSSE